MKAIVTGGAGFIGSHLVEELIRRGDEIVIIDDLTSGKTFPFQGKYFWCNLSIVTGLRSTIYHDDVRQCFLDFKPDIVFHLAALPGVAQCEAQHSKSYFTNVMGTQQMLENALVSGAKRFIFSSSSSVYGGVNLGFPTSEIVAPNPKSHYAMEKLMGEMLCRNYSERNGLDTVCLRYFNVFGPRQRDDIEYAAVIPAFYKARREGKSAVIYGDGSQTRDFCYVTNVVDTNLLAAESNRRFLGEVFNVGCGDNISIKRLSDVVQTPGVEYRQARQGDVMFSQADIQKARNLLGYEPRISLEEGLRLMEIYNGN